MSNQLALPAGSFKAYLFDLDGTIADSMPLHYKAWTHTLAGLDVEFPEALFYEWGGIPPERIVELLNERGGTSLSPRQVVNQKEAVYRSMLPDLQPVGPVLAHVLASSGTIPFAIVSGSPRASIVSTLAVLGLSDHFPLIVGSEDYRLGKPHPEPFLTAAALLQVAPADCLVFEDADAGIASAVAAGMQYVRVPLPSLREG